MNFSSKIKNEIIKKDLEKDCCKVSALSGFLRTSGTVETRNGKIGFSLVGEIDILNYFATLIDSIYGETSQIIAEKSKNNRAKLELISDKSLIILEDCGIIETDNGGIKVELSIADKLKKNTCCRRSFIIGAFLGSGTVTLPRLDKPTATGYHLEFAFMQYITATEFSELLVSFGFMPKLIERKEYYVVYIKNAEAINDFVTLIGAVKASLEITDIIIQKNIKNDTNRAVNCEMSNLSKQINASFRDLDSIQIINDTIGLNNLPQPLFEVASARKDNPDMTLKELSEQLRLTKSCLSHRLRRLNEIADDLK